MGNSLKKVKPGDPLRITAKAWNEFIDAAELVKSLRHSLGNTGGKPGRLYFSCLLSRHLPGQQPTGRRKL